MRMRGSIGWRVLFVVLGGACSREVEPDTAPALQADRGPSPACIDRTAKQEAALARIPEDGLVIGRGWTAEDLVLLEDSIEAARTIEERSVAIHAYPEGLSGSGGNSPDAWTGNGRQAFLEAELEVDAGTGGSRNVVVIARRDTPWSVMAALFGSLRDVGKTEVDLVFARDVEIPPIPPSSIDEELAALKGLSPDARSTGLANLAQKVIGPCKSLERLFGSIASVDPDTRLQTVLTGTPKAMRDCDCSTDVDAVTSLVHSLVMPEVVPAVVRISLAPAIGAAETLALGGDTTWLEAHTRVLAARERPIAHVVE